MKDILNEISSLFFIIIFISGYFPVNMILAYIYGDKSDVVISLLIPFYGFFVMLFQ